MARARTEAQKRAERKYDQKKREIRGEIWALIGYPESLPDNWLDILNDLHIQILISPLHDRDVNADGEIKKPHYHIVLLFESLKSLSQVKEIAEMLNCPAPKKQDSKRGIARYLCHLDNPEKAQYSVDDVRALGGADYRSIISMANEKYEVISEIIEWLESNTDIHHWSFARLLRWSQENNEKWFRGLCDNCAWVVKEYLQSRYWEMKEGFREDMGNPDWTVFEALATDDGRVIPGELIGGASTEGLALKLAQDQKNHGKEVLVIPPGQIVI